jgi:hypothetical protein
VLCVEHFPNGTCIFMLENWRCMEKILQSWKLCHFEVTWTVKIQWVILDSSYDGNKVCWQFQNCKFREVLVNFVNGEQIEGIAITRSSFIFRILEVQNQFSMLEILSIWAVTPLIVVFLFGTVC